MVEFYYYYTDNGDVLVYFASIDTRLCFGFSSIHSAYSLALIKKLYI